MFHKTFIKESKSKLETKVYNLIKKQGYAVFTDGQGIEAHITDIDDGFGYGMTMNDEDVEVKLDGNSQKWFLEEGTTCADIAQSNGKVKMQKKKMPNDFEEIDDELSESPVGMVGRTGMADANAHVTNMDTKKILKDMMKQVGGKTVLLTIIKEL